MTPSSSGSRNPSSAALPNSPSSSMNRIPWLARETSPGRRWCEPPPTNPTTEVVWCGARKGGWRTSPPGGSGSPAAECTIVVSNAWSRSSGGSSPARRCASIVLPLPGEPTRSTWWPPAAAISSARLATGWPRTSLRSGIGGKSTSSSTAARSSQGRAPVSAATAVARSAAARTGPRAAIWASTTLPGGTTTATSSSASTIGATPGTRRIVPSSPNSPMKA